MKNLLFLLFSLILFSCGENENDAFVPVPVSNIPVDSSSLQVPERPLYMLALGDSYTIGASVKMEDRWNEQLKIQLEQRGYQMNEIKYVARTGWTTNNLKTAMRSAALRTKYDMVSLLIGVNNQYQRIDINVFRREYEELLDSAILYARDDPKKVIVLSIPDYGYTYSQPSPQITEEINRYNNIKEEITRRKGVVFHDITSLTRLVRSRPELIASDGLHPSGELYKLWVNLISDDVYEQFLAPPSN
ncbi:SGNH/GDSL hydrolase family protein [Flammeovirga aprica]|uniref:SGNH/GDSL hydrolase family protein n=1 Tax=Flammeovirga aprica JL-4 TaxID=694437 RepID=A0A7X9P027_9BACT|nr:SGNH/GDSL hydrolase family protein [Flammeovirga aprica]NME66845.1 SGNH/GDSL hydrolase family protein [Flammeovirga aprica JL-4]